MDAFESQFSGHPAESHPQPRGWSSGMRAEFATHRIEPGWHIKPLTPEAQALLFSLGNEIVDELERNIIQRGIKLGFSRADFQPLFEKIRPEAEKFLEETLYPEILPKVDAQGILVQDVFPPLSVSCPCGPMRRISAKDHPAHSCGKPGI